MMELEKLQELGEKAGFSKIGHLDCSTIELREEVRAMCQANSCHMYGKRWSCPPGCGSLDTCRERVSHYREGILVQTIGELEDALDGEGMMETEARHKENFIAFEQVLRELYPNMLAIGSGCCTRCRECTYPDAPCRQPDKAFASMEAYGMLVTQVCQANDLTYYYGPCTIAYTGCYLLD
jgi:predicted metal-binding protein